MFFKTPFLMLNKNNNKVIQAVKKTYALINVNEDEKINDVVSNC